MMKAFGVGRLTRKPEVKAVGETVVCEFSLAVDEFRRQGGERKKVTHFFNFEVWDKAAEVFAKKDKGQQVVFTAIPRENNWEDKTTGQKRSRTVFRIEDFSFTGAPKQESAPEPESTPVQEEVDDEVPF